MTKAITETTLHRTTAEPPSCVQYRHGWHSSTTPHLTATWAQDHEDNHAQMYSTRRRSFQAKLARPIPQAHDPSVGRTFFFIHALAPDSI